ncbi:MAG: hypothetical protein RMK74_09860 [Myxococcales bacterium]|nr:hypothetical protein [Myxococcales bacterium]
MRTGPLVGLVAPVWGCAPGPVPPGDAACGSASGEVEVGQGGASWSPLPRAGGSLRIVRGSQGGVHVLVGFRARGLPPRMDVVYELRGDDGALVGEARTALSLTPGLFTRDGDALVRNPDLLVLDWDEDRSADFAGVTAVLTLEARTDGGTACDARRVVLEAPPP